MTLGEAFAKRFTNLLNEKNISLYKFAKDSCIPRITLNNILVGNTKIQHLLWYIKLQMGSICRT